MSVSRRIDPLLIVSFVLIASTSLAAQQQPKSQEEASNATVIQSSDQQEEAELTIEEIRSLLNSIDPYLPESEVSGEIDIVGSTSMDALAHHWANNFRKFHNSVEVKVAATGSEAVFDRLAERPASIGMLSRPVSEKDLAKLKEKGLKRPVSILVARDALGVFVHESNPLESISYPQLIALFCAEDPQESITWSAAGLEEDWSKKDVHIIGRDVASGTRHFIDTYLFNQLKLRKQEKDCTRNGDVAIAISEDPLAIGIADFKYHPAGTRRLKLRTDTGVVEGNDHEMLLGHYPMTRPMCLVFDADNTTAQGKANLEFIRFALTREGQTGSILVGFFPYDPPTLRAQLAKLKTNPQRNY